MAWALAWATALAGCATPPPPKPPVVGLMDVIERPAEKSLLAGMRAYDDGQYAQAETQLQTALGAGLASARDRAAAHKLLAFLFCASNRIEPCEQAFRAARAADPSFVLSRGEANHPLWGPVYRRTLGAGASTP